MPVAQAVRQRKAHRKSRTGCSSCKLRSVKCDEAKPSCQRCLSSGFTCSYARDVKDLHFSQASVFKIDLETPLARPAFHRHVPLAYPIAGKIGSYELRQNDLRHLDVFVKSTWLTLGGGERISRSWYTAGALGLSNSHPFLLHIFIVLSQLHAIHENPSSTRSHTLAFHWYHGAALFQRMLTQALGAPALSSSERDTLWIAAAMLGTATFAYLGPSNPDEAWPLRDTSPDDLDWLKMGTGKKVVWELTDPTRPDSLFNQKALRLTDDPPPDGRSPIRPHGLPALFFGVFGLGASSTADSNPYHVAASLLSQLLPAKATPHNVHHFLSFMSQMDSRYQALLVEKDPRALVLLLYWMAKMASYPMWWTRGRVLYEGLAIAVFIDRHYANERELMDLIAYPRAILSAVRAGVESNRESSVLPSQEVQRKGQMALTCI